MRLLRKALEEASDGKAFDEIEYTFYGRIENMDDLKKATSREHHSQWEVKIPETDNNAGKGTIRVRKTIPNIVARVSPEYVLTTKVNTKTNHHRIEVPVPTTADNFKQFQLLSERGLIKDRYNFPIEGTDLIFEFDMFYLPGAKLGSGKYCEWCKIDIEVPHVDTPIPELPISVLDLIKNQEGKRTKEEENIISSLYENEFGTKNIFL